ncbi:hypothetical protein TSUD_255100 [Trifolium subterraneum]|uniref:Association with the SNF1 complex (ASC) domain-containing protein n=1 Tax=Trifolium subterraneum TaxID=3900 RepID=A0A2Z6LKD8_TRISU|nr:hypothetical protein TSUD_255100 [Trifolium subterraneum]
MGSNSRGKDGEGTSGINRVEDDDEQEMNFVPSEILFLNSNNMNTNGFVAPFIMQQDYIPQRAENEVEDPPSPLSSYGHIFLNENDYNKPPPELPPQIPVTLEEASTSNTDPVPSFTHTQLNHLYQSDGDQFVALRSTQRFQDKFVTTILYKSRRRET